MTVEQENPIPNVLTADEVEALKEDRERWARMSGGGHLADWLAYGPGLTALSRVAMARAGTNERSGSKYAKEFEKLLQEHGLHTMPAKDRTAVLWLYEDPARLDALQRERRTMTPGQRARFNSPITARQHVEKRLDIKPVQQEKKLSPTEKLRRQLEEKDRVIAERDREIADLKAAAEERDWNDAAPRTRGGGDVAGADALGEKDVEVTDWRVARETPADHQRFDEQVAMLRALHQQSVQNRHILDLDPSSVPEADWPEYIRRYDEAHINRPLVELIRALATHEDGGMDVDTVLAVVEDFLERDPQCLPEAVEDILEIRRAGIDTIIRKRRSYPYIYCSPSLEDARMKNVIMDSLQKGAATSQSLKREFTAAGYDFARFGPMLALLESDGYIVAERGAYRVTRHDDLKALARS